MFATKQVAGMAHTRFLPVAPHNPTGPVMNAMTMHLAAAIPNFSIFETVSIDVPWRKELVKENLAFDGGDLLVPTAPGLGVELIEENFAKVSLQADRRAAVRRDDQCRGRGGRRCGGRRRGSDSPPRRQRLELTPPPNSPYRYI